MFCDLTRTIARKDGGKFLCMLIIALKDSQSPHKLRAYADLLHEFARFVSDHCARSLCWRERRPDPF